jgi:hypothetical protein
MDCTDSPATLDLAIEWLRRCIASHPECNKLSIGARIPTRLLELGYPSPYHLRLRKTMDITTRSPYMTLSHCWGSAGFLKLTADTEHQLFKGIHLSKLPKTFQDAVCATKRLGVQYIWIDSLCIDQSSPEDWQREASIMGDIYQGSLCNIAATGSVDSNGGCFHQRLPQLIEPCVIKTQWTDRDNQIYHLCGNLWDDGVECSPLLERGWVVQERLLSPRILHFGRRQVFWECHNFEACETYPFGIPAFASMFAGFKRNTPATWYFNEVELSNKRMSEGVLEEVVDFWVKIVNFYSKCNLSCMEDKLIALSGISKKIQKILNDQYLAGLWRSALPNQLLWRNMDLDCIRPVHYQAPSWSWASINALIHLPQFREYKHQHCNVSVVDVQVNSTCEDLFGQIASGCLRLCGPLLTIAICRKSRRGIDCDELFLNGRTIQQDRGADTEEDWVFMDTNEPPARNTHFMPFFKEDDGYGSIFVTGLLLRPTGRSRGQFTRCGFLHMYVPEEEIVLGSDWTNLQNQEWLEYQSYDGVSNYTISII